MPVKQLRFIETTSWDEPDVAPQDALAETLREPLPAREIMRGDAGETERLLGL